MIGQVTDRRPADMNEADLFQGYDVVERDAADAAPRREKQDTEQRNREPDRWDACIHASHRRARVGIVFVRFAFRRPLLQLFRPC